MPELPEVTTTVSGLNETLPNLTIREVWTDYFLNTKSKRTDTIKNKKYFDYFRKEIVGAKVLNAERRGKNILIHLSNNKTMLIHMKMTGHLLYGKYKFENKKWKSYEEFLSDPFSRFIHLLFTLSNGKHLAFSDMRKFAKVTLFETDKRASVSDLSKLGPEPIPNLSTKTLSSQLLKKPNGKIKTVLMDQSIIAGIGNIYSDEILWASGIHPERTVSRLSEKEIDDICKYTKKILTSSIKIGGDSMSDYRNIYGRKCGFQNAHNAYKRNKEKCLKNNCQGTIRREVIGGRSTHFCDIHQK